MGVIIASTFFFSNIASANIKVGIAADQDLSIVLEYSRFNVALGNKGVAVDYSIITGKFEEKQPLSWYVSAGGYVGWNNGYGVRVPLGIKWYFAKNWDLYAQVHPKLDFDNGTDLSLDGAVGVRYAF